MIEFVIGTLGLLGSFLLGRLLGQKKEQERLGPLLEQQQFTNEDSLLLLAKMKGERERIVRSEKTHREMNEQFEAQRQEAWRRYHAAGSAAGNAQAMLLRQLEEAVRQLNQYRQKDGKKPIQVNPSLKGVVEEFKRDHVNTSEVSA